VAADRHNGTLALHIGVAFAGYVLGSVGGAHVAGAVRDGDGLWPRPMTLALCAELLVFCAFAAGWEAAGAHPAGSATLVLLAANAAGLGIQSSAVLRLGVSGLSTTYPMGTLTGVMASLVTRTPLRTSSRSVAILVALVAGAGLGALLAIRAPAAAPAALLAVLATVIVAAFAVFCGDRPAPPAGGPALGGYEGPASRRSRTPTRRPPPAAPGGRDANRHHGRTAASGGPRTVQPARTCHAGAAGGPPMRLAVVALPWLPVPPTTRAGAAPPGSRRADAPPASRR